MTATVLILDDSLTVRMDLADAFETAGCQTFPCATAKEARAVLESDRADVVILDVLLPDGDGVEFLRELRSFPFGARAVVLMLSTEAEVSDRLRGMQTGADEYIGKPYDTSYVVRKAQELLRARVSHEARATTVLIIDDSATFRHELGTACVEAGYEVFTAGSGNEGLRMAAAERPAVIVVDGVLPDIDGGTVIRRIRLDVALRGVPCLLLTASEDRRAEMHALDAGADAFVRKDGDVTVVLARLGALLRTVTSTATVDGTPSLLGPKKILAVDDSPTYLHELAGRLRSEGYDVVTAKSGEEALELVGVQAVDCILLDLLMPGLGGQEACRRIKSVPVVRDVPLIMLTSLEDRAAMIDALSSGADDYIQKSAEFEVLTARVRAQNPTQAVRGREQAHTARSCCKRRSRLWRRGPRRSWPRHGLRWSASSSARTKSSRRSAIPSPTTCGHLCAASTASARHCSKTTRTASTSAGAITCAGSVWRPSGWGS